MTQQTKSTYIPVTKFVVRIQNSDLYVGDTTSLITTIYPAMLLVQIYHILLAILVLQLYLVMVLSLLLAQGNVILLLLLITLLLDKFMLRY